VGAFALQQLVGDDLRVADPRCRRACTYLLDYPVDVVRFKA
jgi:hypothetical protein